MIWVAKEDFKVPSFADVHPSLRVSPVSIYFKPFFVVKVNDKIYMNEAMDISIEQNCNWGFKNERSQSLVNTATITIPNTNALTGIRYNSGNKIEIWGDYLEPGDEAKNEEILTIVSGRTRIATKLFTGYIYDIQPTSDSGGNKVKLICKNSLFKLRLWTPRPRSYGGNFKDRLNEFLKNESVFNIIKCDFTNIQNLNVNINVGSNDSTLDVIERFRVQTAHIGYVDSDDVLHFEPFEDTINLKNKTYFNFEYGKNLIDCSYASEINRVNTVIIYFGMNIDESRKITITDDFNISAQGRENVRKIVNRDISNHADAYKLAVNILQQEQLQAQPLTSSTFFFPYMKVFDVIKATHVFLNVEGYFLITKITHTINANGAKTEMEGMATMASALGDRVISSKRISALGVSW